MSSATKLLITRVLPEATVERARASFDVEMLTSGAALSREDAAECLRGYDAAISNHGDMFDAGAFEAVPNPRCGILANFGAGYDHIDVDAARRRGVAVTNTPGAVTDATADIAVSLMLMAARRTAEGDRLVRRGGWRGWQPTEMLGRHVTGKSLGIIGMGRIGSAVARRCHFGFGMDVSFHNRSPARGMEFPATQLGSAQEVMETADFIVVTVRGGPASRHLITGELLRAMRPHAVFVNVSRGDVVDEAELVRVLKEGRIAAAGLDVYEFEPAVPDELLVMENVVLLPHLGTSVLEVREDMGRMAVENVEAFVGGKTPPNLVS